MITPLLGAKAPTKIPTNFLLLIEKINDPDCPGLVCVFITADLDFIPFESNITFAPITAF